MLAIQKTHYEILSVKEDADFDEIRASYRASVLHCHPDKVQGKMFTVDGEQQEVQERFLKVQKAWDVLSNSESRAAYDRELNMLRQDLGMADEVGLEDMMVEEDGESFELFLQCRCGDYFSINSHDMGELGFDLSMRKGKVSWLVAGIEPVSIMIPCGSCSLKILLTSNQDCNTTSITGIT